MLKLDVGNIPAKPNTTSIPRPRRPAWDKATEENRTEYTALLEDKLELLVLPDSLLCANVHCKNESHGNERDSFVLDIMTSVIECSHECIPLSNKVKATVTDPNRNCPIQRALPGWKEDIAPLREDSLFWHAVWISAGRPRGDL